MRASRLTRIGLRLRIAGAAALLVAVALLAGAALLVDLLHNRLHETARTAASLRAADVAGLANAGALPATLALPGEESSVVQVVNAAGIVISSSENIAGEPPISDRRPLTSSELSFVARVNALDARDPMRVVATQASTPSGPVVVYAAENLERSEDTVREVTAVLAGALPLLVVFVGGLSWWAVGRALRPVQAITETMADITATDLHRRVPVNHSGDEISHLASTVNATLERLDIAVERQRRFVADASHELRGPLAALRADLEISLAHPDRTDWPTTARDSLSDVERLQTLTEDLLVLARLDETRRNNHQPVDLANLIREQAAHLRRVDIDVELDLGSDLVVEGDRDQLRRMLRNLLANAEQHTTSRIEVHASRSGHDVCVTISDDGPGIPAADRSRVFERFVRLDDARTRDTGGTGLGLAIVQNIVHAHHGRVTIQDAEPTGASFTVALPATTAAHRPE